MTKFKNVAKKFDANLNTLAREVGPTYVGLGLGTIVGEGLLKAFMKGGNYNKMLLRKQLGDQVVIYSVLTLVGAGIMTISDLHHESKDSSDEDETCEGCDESFAE